MVNARKVTLVDVAGRAGVSTTTASYILNGRSAQMRISPDTARRVRQAVADLGYRPNRSARSLRTASTKTIGVISDFLASGEFASRMLTGATAAARRSGHLLLIGETEGDRGVEALLIQEMLDRQVDGIVYAALTTATITAPALLAQQRAVLLNCVDPDTSLPAVVPDEFEGGRAAASELIRAGLVHDVWVVGEDPTPNALAGPLRLQGILARFREGGHEPAGVVRCEWAVADAYDALHQWLGRGVRPTALICLNDRIAMGAYQALAARGLRVPDDVSVVSFDGSALSTWLRPRLTSVALPFTELGALAVQTLLGADRTAATLRVPMPVAAGRSVGGPGRVRRVAPTALAADA
jgi:LacI family transcriptional regulator, galactose operon repressor